MKRFVLFTTLSLVLIAGSALADIAPPQMHSDALALEQAQAAGMAKAFGDTIYLIGNPADPGQWYGGEPPQVNGTFQNQYLAPLWHGWTSVDRTYSEEVFWNASDFHPISGVYSMWCGKEGWANGDDGYGNSWNVSLLLTHTVASSMASSAVVWTGTIRVDSEPDYDYTYLEYQTANGWNELQQYDGVRTHPIAESFVYAAGSYVGTNNDEIQIRVRFESDGAWSDEDGLYQGDGACQFDDTVITVDGVIIDDEDFEDGPGGTYNWIPILDVGVGDYAELYINLLDEDPCNQNTTPQVAFIDDGVVVPGTGGFPCTTWCYGPGGWIVNPEGGLMGPDYHIHNAIESPVLDWPAGTTFDGAIITFSAYRHEELGAQSVWPGMFYQWKVRSADVDEGEDIYSAVWDDRNFVYYGTAAYVRPVQDVTDLMAKGRDLAQLQLSVYEYGHTWGWVGTDGTPAPYFDSVQWRVYDHPGPGVAGREIDWFQDNFPTVDELDFVNLGNNDVRLDTAINVGPASDLTNIAGDSIWFDIKAVRDHYILDGHPKMFIALKMNPLFDAGLRGNTSEISDVVIVGDVLTGWVFADSTYTNNGNLVDDRWNFDLPDDDFFYPGDVLHYYVVGYDKHENDAGPPGDTYFPANDLGDGPANGFGDFETNMVYPIAFTVRALPTMFTATAGDQPPVLFWNDNPGRGGDNEWFYSLHQLGYHQGVDYDMYATSGPSSGVGNGLGGRATSLHLEGYNTMLYTGGSLSVNLLANNDYENDPSDDLNVVSNWLAQGDKNAFMTADNMVSALEIAGSFGLAFVNQFFNVNSVDRSVLDLIDGQTAPTVAAIAGNGVIASVDEWIAYGGCPGINTFDAFTHSAGAVQVAEFLDLNGNSAYPYSAAVYNHDTETGADVVMMPIDFQFLYNAPGFVSDPTPGLAARTVILDDILLGFGEAGGSGPIGVTPDAVFAVSNFPNPFNPTTTIKLTLPRAGDVSLKVFNVRGALVRTLINGQMDAGSHEIVWDGKTDQGNQTASGVYFYETRAGGEVKVNKMALVK